MAADRATENGSPARKPGKGSRDIPRPVLIGLIAAAVLAILFAYFIWPTPWVYSSDGPTQYRTNRFTAVTEMRLSDGWVSQ